MKGQSLKHFIPFIASALILLAPQGAHAQAAQAVPQYNGQTPIPCAPSPSDKNLYQCQYPDGSFVTWLLGPTDWTVLTYRNGSCRPDQCDVHATPDGLAYFNSHSTTWQLAPNSIVDDTSMPQTPITAQPGATSPLTIDSLSNAAYLSILLDPPGSSHLVQLNDGSYPSDSLPEAPTFDADGLNIALFNKGQISGTGDLNGDGAQDIAAVFVEAQSGQNDSLLVVEAYLNQNGQPVPTAAIKVGDRTTALTSLSIQSDLITLSGLRMGSNDAMCCPSQPFTQVFSLQGNQLVDVSTRTAAQPAAPVPTSVVAGSVPANTADISSVRSAIPGGQSGFAGQVLMPPAGLQPFASLQLFSAVPGLGEDTLSDTSHNYPQAYSLVFVNALEQSQRQFGVASATVAGASSRQMYDNTAAEVLKTFTSCASTAAYCGRPNFPPCTQMGCTIHAEIFRGLKVKGADALVLHWWDDHALGWDVVWFDSRAGVSYRLETQDGADPTDFDTGLSAKNQAGAQQLAAVAEKLVPWTGS